ncbi:hypothetical protein [Nitrosomonas mobilis]|uniref:Uncharacterized protein n=1 Tax=Nitrosomonas mobilis TaxID=51642 RepID=A0A1G5SFZ9_9PROT|nr:hypothetical protein [Nitrosomonas mobilis]SCZ85790.1 conserved hypothetical protein [Nitrosomonas mobilis]
MAIPTAKELCEALKNNWSSVEIEGSLSRKALRIKATGKISSPAAIAAGGVAAAIANPQTI